MVSALPRRGPGTLLPLIVILFMWLAPVAHAAVSAQAVAPAFPPLSGRVVDAAHILPPALIADLSRKSAALEAKNGTQFVVATIPDLGGMEIADYGYRLGRHWGLGEKGKNNGVILLIAPRERRVRVEVGYGLEPVLTDALSSLIVQTQIIPAFKRGDMAAGVAAGAQAILNQLGLPPDQARQNVRAAAHGANVRTRDAQGSGLGGAIGIFFLLAWLGFAFAHSRGGKNKGRGRRHGSGIAPVIIWGPGFGGGFGGGSGSGGGFGGGSFGGGGGSFGGGGASGEW